MAHSIGSNIENSPTLSYLMVEFHDFQQLPASRSSKECCCIFLWSTLVRIQPNIHAFSLLLHIRDSLEVYGVLVAAHTIPRTEIEHGGEEVR